jgi:hypothetical protein
MDNIKNRSFYIVALHLAVNNACKVVGNNKTYLGLQVKCPSYMSDFNQFECFSTDFCKSPVSNFTKFGPMEAQMMQRTDGRTSRS